MKITIWSDVVCPFCYIGKRRLETALAAFPNREEIEIEWKSFLLDPSVETEPGKNIHQHLAERKGWSMQQTKEITANVTHMAEGEGLHYDFDHTVVANSNDAHRLIQFAKVNGKGDAIEERLFKAYFCEGKNIDDQSTLTQLGEDIGLDAAGLKQLLESDAYALQVDQDIMEAQQIGVRGVPFFVFNQRYAVSGAQESRAFLEVLEKSFGEWRQASPAQAMTTTQGQACEVDGECN